MSKKLLTIISIILIVLSSVAYSGLATSLAITGEANIRAVTDIRITDIQMTSVSGSTLEQYSSKYTKNTTTTGFLLYNTTDSITYTITIANKGDSDQALYGLNTVSNNNGMHVLINGEEINDELPIIIGYKTTTTITLTFTTSVPSQEVINAITTFDFREVYYITYNSKGGTAISPQIKYENVNINITTDTPAKTGYIFLSWNDMENGNGTTYTSGSSYTLNSNKVLYAQYQSGTYQITLDEQNATTSGTDKIFEKYNVGYYLDSAGLTRMTPSQNEIIVPAKDGYKFGGYYTSTGGSGTQYIDENGRLTNDADTTQFSNIGTLYAKWTPNVLTINYYAGGANKDNNVNISNQLLVTDTYNYDGEDLKTTGLKNYDSSSSTWNLSKTGYTATKYWHLGNATSNTKVHEDTLFNKIQDLANAYEKLNEYKVGDVTLNIYAGWQANTYTVTYNGNNSTGGTTALSTHTYDITKTLTANGFTRTGYTFIGWNTSADGTGTPYLNEASVTNLTDVNNDNIDLFAQWTPNSYTIIFDKNDNSATGSMSNLPMTYGTPANLTLNSYAKTGYKFIGWNTASDGSGTTYTDGQSVSNLAPSGNKTLYAQWMRVMAENLEYEEQELHCVDAQCTIDELYYMLY